MPYALCHIPYAISPMPYPLCHIPYALCHIPYARRVPHVTEKGYNYQGLPIIVKAAQ